MNDDECFSINLCSISKLRILDLSKNLLFPIFVPEMKKMMIQAVFTSNFWEMSKDLPSKKAVLSFLKIFLLGGQIN